MKHLGSMSHIVVPDEPTTYPLGANHDSLMLTYDLDPGSAITEGLLTCQCGYSRHATYP